MAAKYLLPCSCGEKVAVESRQAGQRILCSCGQTLQVPTMQGMRQLEISAESPGETRPKSVGGVGIGIALLGCIILGSGGAYASWVYNNQRPSMPDINYNSPWDSWLIWQSLQEGVRLPEYVDSPYLQAKRIYDQYMALATAIIVVGIITTACGVIVAVVNGMPRRRQTAQRAP